MQDFRLRGLIAATYTPFQDDGTLDLSKTDAMVEHLERQGVDGLYVCGSTGEGVSMTGAERREVAAAFVKAIAGRKPVVVQVGHNSLFEARDLAAHAQQIGASAVSANAPSYFKVTSIDGLVDSMALIAAGAPSLPFYYYHIPHLTGADLSMVDFLNAAKSRIPSLVGVKYTALTAHEFQSCVTLDDGRFDILWGSDEMLLAALAVGAQGAVGSTYNLAAPIYRNVIDAFSAGKIDVARHAQALAIEMIRIIYQWPFHPAMRELLRLVGADCGPCRLPHPRIDEDEVLRLRAELESIQFFDWSANGLATN